MQYNFTDTGSIPVTMTLTVSDLERLVRILDPIAKDDSHPNRYRAADIVRQARDAHESTRKALVTYVQYMTLSE